MRIRFLLTILLLTLGLSAGPAHALRQTLRGDATVGAQQYRGESAGMRQEATSLYQQYTVTVTREDNFYKGRAGVYTLMVGYELNRLAPTFERNGVRDPEVTAINAGKLYYNGSLTLAPGGLPFRLTLYARDTKRTFFVDNASYDSYATGLQAEFRGQSNRQLLTPGIFTDVDDGTHQDMGATLLLGIRNGSYLGAYRDVLSQLPRLLIDYKQSEVEDTHSTFDKTHYLTRDLAFVSLNKKDNWVHLRMRDHSDFLNPFNDTATKQVMVGTVDHVMARQWVNMTNWIKVSGDLSYTLEKKVAVDPVHTYLMNMFVVGQRNGVASTVYSRFSRENDGRFLDYEAEIPMNVTVDFDRDTRFRSRFIYESKETSLLAGQFLESNDPFANFNVGAADFTDLYIDNQLELLRSRRIIVKPRLEVESRQQGDNRDGLATRLGAEVQSNSQLNKSFLWLGGYALTVTRSNDATRDATGTFIQNEIYGRGDKNLSRALRVGGRSSLTVGSGEGRQGVGFRIPTMSGGLSGGAGSSDNVDSSYGGMLTRGDLSLFLDHRYQRLGNRLEVGFEFFSGDDVTTQRSTLQHALSYHETAHRFDWQSTLSVGEKIASYASVNFDYLGAKNIDNNSAIWESKLTYQYDPNRSAGLTLIGDIRGSQGDDDNLAYRLAEKLFYRIFTSNGIVRRLAEFSEEIGYEKVTLSVDGRGTSLFGRFSALYFPTRYFYAKLGSEVVAYLGSSAQQHISHGEVGFDFEKLKLAANYSQAYKDRESALLPEIKEERWEVKVKKIF